MKYCTKCGHELFDEAVMCVGCGCMVAAIPEAEVAPKPVDNDKKNTLSCVFNFVCVILLALSIFHIIIALLEARVETDLNFYSDYSYYIYSYFRPDYDILLTSVLLAVPAIGFALASLIISAVKSLKPKYILTAIAEIVIAGLIITATTYSL